MYVLLVLYIISTAVVGIAYSVGVFGKVKEFERVVFGSVFWPLIVAYAIFLIALAYSLGGIRKLVIFIKRRIKNGKNR